MATPDIVVQIKGIKTTAIVSSTGAPGPAGPAGTNIDQFARDTANAAYANANTAIYTAAQIRANISNTAPINYSPSTGIISHADSGVTATTYGNTTFVPTITVDVKGHVTSISNTAIALPPSTDEFARAQANAAFNQANTANVTGQAAFDKANGAIYTAAQIRANISNTRPILYDPTTGVISFVPATANGQLLIGNTVSGSFDVNVLTQGAGILITNDKGAVTITANVTSATDQFARDQANAAFNQANTANVTGQAAFDKANGAIYTAAQIRANISNTAPINYDPSTGVISHALSGVTASGYGDAATVAKVVVDSNGHVTSVVNTAIAISATQITSGTLAVARGGTAQTAINGNGSLLIGNTVSGAYDVNTLTQGTGILITNDKGSITIAATGGASANGFGVVNVAGQSDLVAEQANDTLTIIAGTGIIITTDAAGDNLTITATGGSATDQYARDKANGAAQNAFVTLNVAGQSDIVADSNTDTLTIVGSGITITTVAGTDTLTIQHPASGVTPSGYGDAATVPKFVVDANGHVTSVVNTAIAISATQITSGTLAVARGGTGQTAITVNGSLLIGNTVSGGFDVNPITQGTNIIITNDKGSITIASSDAFAQSQANAAYDRANAAYANANTAIYTAAQIRANISNTAPIRYDATTGIVSHADSGVTPSGYGDAATIPVFVANVTGHISSVVNTAIAISATQITSGTLAVIRGGTGQTAITVNGSLLIGNTVSGGFDVNTITPGTNITVVNDKGSITIASSDAFAQAQANAAFNQANAAFSKANGAAQNAFVTISVAGESDVVADSNTDTLTFVEGPGIVFTTVPSNDSIIVTSTAYGNSGDRVFYENDQNVTANYSITLGKSASSTGPITINPGVFVTVPSGSRWVVI